MTPLAKAARALVLQESGTDSFDGLETELQEQVIESVKAVLMALREPSDTMAEASLLAFGLPAYGTSSEDATLAWQRMIDAAIAEG